MFKFSGLFHILEWFPIFQVRFSLSGRNISSWNAISSISPNKQYPDAELSVVYSNRKSEIAKNAKLDEIFPPIQDRAGTAFFKLLKI